jgi:hypothetical protein
VATGPVGPVGSVGRKAAVSSARVDPLPDLPDRQAYLVLKVSRCRGGARFTVATACFDGSDGAGVDALADITGGDSASDESSSVGTTDGVPSKGRRGVSRAGGASRGGRRRHDGRGDERGRERPDEDEPSEDGDEPAT